MARAQYIGMLAGKCATGSNTRSKASSRWVFPTGEGSAGRRRHDGRSDAARRAGHRHSDGVVPLDAGVTASEIVVRARLVDFIDRCVRSVALVKCVSIEVAADVDDANRCVWQAVAEVEGEDRWWLARLYGRCGGSEVLLVHWNGPGKQMKDVVIKSFASLEPLFASAGRSAVS